MRTALAAFGALCLAALLVGAGFIWGVAYANGLARDAAVELK